MRALDRIGCEDVIRRLDEYADRQLSAEEARRMERHLATCTRCFRKFRFERALVAETRAKLQRVEIPPGLRARVLAALAS